MNLMFENIMLYYLLYKDSNSYGKTISEEKKRYF